MGYIVLPCKRHGSSLPKNVKVSLERQNPHIQAALLSSWALLTSFLAVPRGTWDPSPLTRDQTYAPLHWKLGLLTTRPTVDILTRSFVLKSALCTTGCVAALARNTHSGVTVKKRLKIAPEVPSGEITPTVLDLHVS